MWLIMCVSFVIKPHINECMWVMAFMGESWKQLFFLPYWWLFFLHVLCSFCLFVFQADLQSTLGDAGYIVFGVILFVWELLPTSLVVFFFRVRQPNQDRVSRQLPSASRFPNLGVMIPPRGHKINMRGKQIKLTVVQLLKMSVSVISLWNTGQFQA